MLFQAARYGGAEPLAAAEDDEDAEAAPSQARAGFAGRRRQVITGVLLVCVAVTGAVVMVYSVALRARWLGSGGTVASTDVLKQSIAAVVVDVARARRMEMPGLDKHWGGRPGLGQGGSDAGEFELHPVEWYIDLRSEASILESQKFRLLKHSDGRITLRDRYGLHLDMADNRSRMKGGVTSKGVLVATPVGETGKFTFLYNFDSTVSLRQANNSCLASTADGLLLLDCDSDGGAVATFTPTVLELEGVVAFKSRAGNFITVEEEWVHDYKTSLRMVPKGVAQKSPYQCAKFHRHEEKDGLISLKTRRASYLTAAPGGALHADAAEVGPEQMFAEIGNDDGSVSLSAPAFVRGSADLGVAPSQRMLRADGSPRVLALLEEQTDGTVMATGHDAGSADGLVLQENSDGTVSLTRNESFLCAAERAVTVATCETRGHGANDNAWPMQGVNQTIRIQNACVNQEWYGFKTKVDSYLRFAEKLANSSNTSDNILILVDNSDMAFGGCSYEELLHRYDLITRLANATVVAGADNSLFPEWDWPYDSLQGRRQVIMQAFGMTTDQFCDVSDCPERPYRYANSGFLMGPPRVLAELLGCMREKGWGNFGKFKFDDQHGLQACMFGDYKNVVALDYSGTLTMELLRMKSTTLYEGNGKVYNRVARGMTQCFVHGNGDTMSSWWPSLFPGMTQKESYEWRTPSTV